MNSKILWSIALGIALLAFIANAFWKSKTSLSNTTTGFILWQAIDNWVDMVVYPVVLVWLGMTWGFVTMFVATLALNASYIAINNATKVDWTLMTLFIELPWVKKVISWKIGRVNLGKTSIFLILCFKLDSFYATNFLFGKTASFKSPKVLVLFLASHAVSNLAWTFLWEAALVSGKFFIELLGKTSNL